MNNQHIFCAQWQLEPQIFFDGPWHPISSTENRNYLQTIRAAAPWFCFGPKSFQLALATYCFPFRYWRWECLSKNGMSQITSRSYLSWRLELLAGHMYGIRRVIFPQTPAHVDSSFNFRLYKTFRRKNVQNFTFSTPPSSRSTFAAHGFSILSTIDSYYLNYRSVHSGFSISGFVPIELPVPPGPLSFPLCVLSLIACLSFSQPGFGGKGEKGGFWNLFGEDEAALWSLRLCWGLREVNLRWCGFFVPPFHHFAHWTAWIYFLIPPSCGERT